MPAKAGPAGRPRPKLDVCPALPAIAVKFYKNVFQIICSVNLVIIPANKLEALRHKSEIFDYCLLYHFQFKLYLSKSFLVLNAPMSHRRIHNFLGHISSSLILHREANRAKSASHDKKIASSPPDPISVPYFASLSQAGPALAIRLQCGRTSSGQSPAWPAKPATCFCQPDSTTRSVTEHEFQSRFF